MIICNMKNMVEQQKEYYMHKGERVYYIEIEKLNE